jgi:hypothetical protein
MSKRFMYFLLFWCRRDAGGMIEIIVFICMTKARRIIVKRQQVGRARNFPAVFLILLSARRERLTLTGFDQQSPAFHQ